MGKSLTGKRAIVTGAASGIGRASALLFASEGAQVIAADWAEDGVRETAALVDKAQGEAIALTVDAGDEEQVAAMVARCVDSFGGVDIVYANAGVSGGFTGPLDWQVEDWEKVLRVNLIGPYLAMKHAAREMIKQGGGSLIATASVAGLNANAGGVPYSASKAGVINMVKVMAHGLSGTGVRVNAICPGLIETGMTQPIFDGARARGSEASIGQLNPMLRHGEPDEIAQMALFLASDAASYVNGQAIAVDGGLSASHPFTPRRR